MAVVHIYKNTNNGHLITYTGDLDLTEKHPQLMLMVSIEGWNLGQKIWTDDHVIEPWAKYRKRLKKK